MMLKKLVKWFVRALLVLWFIFTLIVGMWIWRENSTEVMVSYFGFELHQQTLGTVMTTMLVAGFTLGALPMFFTTILRELSHKREIKKVKKSQKTFEKTHAVATPE